MIQTGAPEVGEIPEGEEKSQNGEGKREEKESNRTFVATHGLVVGKSGGARWTRGSGRQAGAPTNLQSRWPGGV